MDGDIFGAKHVESENMNGQYLEDGQVSVYLKDFVLVTR